MPLYLSDLEYRPGKKKDDKQPTMAANAESIKMKMTASFVNSPRGNSLPNGCRLRRKGAQTRGCVSLVVARVATVTIC